MHLLVRSFVSVLLFQSVSALVIDSGHALLEDTTQSLLTYPYAAKPECGTPSTVHQKADSVSGPAVPSCTTFMIPVAVQRTTPTQLSADGDEYSIDVLYALQNRQILVTNNYSLEATYCEPTGGPASRKDSIQVLIHGATLSKVMWDFPYQPEKYSWVRNATAEGFATLAVDQLGAGNSTFADGLLEVQTQTYVETIHQVIEKLRAGKIANKKFKTIIPIGFSLGAVTLVSLADQYPDDADALVLHGFSWNAATLYPAFFAGFQVAAALIDPKKWGHIPMSYTTQSTPRSREITVLYGKYDKGIVPIDFALRDFDTLGASITIPSHSVTARDYTGPVFLANGDQDATFCGQKCGIDPFEVFPRFPNARDHVVKIYPETAHVIHLHYSAFDLMRDTTDFLTKWGM